MKPEDKQRALRAELAEVTKQVNDRVALAKQRRAVQAEIVRLSDERDAKQMRIETISTELAGLTARLEQLTNAIENPNKDDDA